MTTYRKVETVKRTIRYEFEAPVDMKTLGLACTWVAQHFERVHGRMPTYDNDYWLEPTDEGIAFCFTAEERRDLPAEDVRTSPPEEETPDAR